MGACLAIALWISACADPDGSGEAAPPVEEAPAEAGGSTDTDEQQRFRDLIESAVPARGAGTEQHVKAIQTALADWPADDIVQFQRFLVDQRIRAYRWDLWGVAYVAYGGCGDDSFEYFCLWVIAQGREYFERALADAARAVDAMAAGDEAECELLAYAADEAYEAKTGKELPWDGFPKFPSEPAGETWSEDDVHELFPEVAKRFGWPR